jgi:O-antigen/teichoic acid export membrane protein
MRGLRRNATANFLGALIPALVYVWSVPLMLEHLGDQGYGVLALLGAIVGYFAVMDLNMSSGALRFVSHYHASDQPLRVSEVVTFGVAAAAGVGVLGMVLILVFAKKHAPRPWWRCVVRHWGSCFRRLRHFSRGPSRRCTATM